MKLTSDFASVRHSPYFVDKTLFLKQWITFGIRDLYVTAPPRFGKTTLMNMMLKFFGATYNVVDGNLKEVPTEETVDFKLFEKTRIHEEERAFFNKHFKKYYVLYISFRPMVGVKNHESFKESIFSVISNTLHSLVYTLQDKSVDKEWGDWIRMYTENVHTSCSYETESLCFGGKIIEFLNVNFKKPVILVFDDFDSILTAPLVRECAQDSVSVLMDLGLFLKNLVNDESSSKTSNLKQIDAGPKLSRSYFSGTFKLGGIPFATNVVHLDYFYEERIAKFYCFTKSEVKELLRKENMDDDLQRVEDLYGGYSAMKSDLGLFNIVSVITYLRFKKLKYYRERLSRHSLVLHHYVDVFSTFDIGVRICECLHKKRCVVKTVGGTKLLQLGKFGNKTAEGLVDADFRITHIDISLFLTFLVELGLLAVVEEEVDVYTLRPSNESTTAALETYLSRGEFLNNALKFDDQMQRDFENVISNFDATEESMVGLGDAVFTLFSREHPIMEHEYMSVLYILLRKISTRSPEVLEVASAIGAGKGEIETLFYFVDKKILMILEGRERESGARGVDRILSRDFLQVLKDPGKKYSRYVIHHRILWGLSLSSKGINMNFLIDTDKKKGSCIYAREAGSNKGTKTERKE